MNREQWLNDMTTAHVWPLLTAHGASVPTLWRVSVGFPKGSRGGRKSIGQCWPEQSSSDASREMFISPTLEAFAAVEVLVHEVIHCALNNKGGHRGAFKRIAVSCGLIGKMTATSAGPELAAKITEWLAASPAYPHAAMIENPDAKKPGSRLLKVNCEACGYTVRVTQKWVDVGLPTCCCGEQMGTVTA
jgi:hypothetical protein